MFLLLFMDGLLSLLSALIMIMSTVSDTDTRFAAAAAAGEASPSSLLLLLPLPLTLLLSFSVGLDVGERAVLAVAIACSLFFGADVEEVVSDLIDVDDIIIGSVCGS